SLDSILLHLRHRVDFPTCRLPLSWPQQFPPDFSSPFLVPTVPVGNHFPTLRGAWSAPLPSGDSRASQSSSRRGALSSSFSRRLCSCGCVASISRRTMTALRSKCSRFRHGAEKALRNQPDRIGRRFTRKKGR